VLEAFRLLRKSIIHVDSGRMELEDEPGQLARSVAGARAGDAAGEKQDAEASEAAGAPKQRAQITHEAYQRMLRQFVLVLREKEAVVENKLMLEGGSLADADAADMGMTVDELVTWWLKETETGETTMEALQESNKLARKVIRRLVRTDGVLVYANDDESLPEGQRLLMVAPDVVLGTEAMTADYDA
jgi:hypothetical protein